MPLVFVELQKDLTGLKWLNLQTFSHAFYFDGIRLETRQKLNEGSQFALSMLTILFLTFYF